MHKKLILFFIHICFWTIHCLLTIAWLTHYSSASPAIAWPTRYHMAYPLSHGPLLHPNPHLRHGDPIAADNVQDRKLKVSRTYRLP